MMLKRGRKEQNRGVAIKADLKAAVAAAEKILADQGYTVGVESNMWGPDLGGKVVTGYRRKGDGIRAIGKSTLKSIGFGMLRAKKDIKTGTHEVMWVKLNGRWDDTYRKGVPGVLSALVEGGSCDRVVGGRYKNCNIMPDFDGMVMAKQVEAKAAEYAAIVGSGVARTRVPAAGPGPAVILPL